MRLSDMRLSIDKINNDQILYENKNLKSNLSQKEVKLDENYHLLEKIISDKNLIEKDKNLIQIKLEEKNQAYKELEKKLSVIQSQMNESNNLKSNLNQKEVQFDENNKLMEKILSEKKNLDKDKNIMQEMIDNLMRENKELEKKISDTELQMNENKNLKPNASQKDMQFDDNNKMLQKMKFDKSLLEKDKNLMQAVIDEKSQENRDLEKKLLEIKSQMTEEQIKASKNTQKFEIENLIKDKIRLQNELDSLKNLLQNVGNNNTKLTIENTQKNKSIKDLDQTIKKLKESLNIQEKKYFDEKNEILNNSAKKNRVDYDEIEVLRESLKLANDDLEIKTNEIKTQIVKLQEQSKQNADLKKDLTDKKAKLDEKTNEFDKTKSELDNFSKDNDALKKANTNGENKMKKQELQFKSEAKEQNDQILKLSKEIKDLMKELEIMKNILQETNQVQLSPVKKDNYKSTGQDSLDPENKKFTSNISNPESEFNPQEKAAQPEKSKDKPEEEKIEEKDELPPPPIYTYLFTNTISGKVFQYAIEDSKIVSDLSKIIKESILCFAYSNIKKWGFGCSSNGSLYKISVKDNSILQTFIKAHYSKVCFAKCSSDQKFLITCDIAGTITKWNTEDIKINYETYKMNLSNGIKQATFLNDNKHFVTLDNNANLSILGMGTNKSEILRKQISVFTVTHNSQYIFGATKDSELIQWEVPNKIVKEYGVIHPKDIAAMHALPDSSFLFTADSQGNFKQFSIPEMKVARNFGKLIMGGINHFVSTLDSKTLQMCNVGSGSKVIQWSIQNRNFINSSTISIVDNTGGSSTRIVNNKNAKVIKEVILHNDGGSLFTVDSTNCIKQWDIGTGDFISSFNENNTADISKIMS